MARINTYSTDTTVQNNDKLLGSNADGTTRNFSVEDISAFQANTNSAAIIGQLPYIYHNNSFGGNSSRQAGSITINTTDTTTAFSSVTTLKFSKTPNGYTSDVVAVLTAFLNKDIIVSSNDDPNNFATYKCTAVTQDSSETDFYDLSLTYIAGNGNLEVGKFYSTSRDISTSENTTYDISIPSGTTSLRLTGSDASADDIVISGSGGVTVSRTSANILDISSTPEQYNGTVTSVSGAGTVSGLTLSGTVTSSGSLTLGGSLVLTSSQITTGLGFTPYNATNPNGYTSFAEPGIFSGSGSPTLASGVTAAEIRNLIGAGTSSLVLGTSSSTALAGDTVTISGSQASAISANTLKVSDTGVPAILSDGSSPSLNTGITAAEVRTLIGAGTSNTTGTVTGTGTTNYLSKFTGSSAIGDSIVFDNGTNVGVGTASPSEKLDIAGSIVVNTGQSLKWGSGATRIRGIDGSYISLYPNNSEKVRFLSNGNVLIGTTTDNGDKLTVAGAISTTHTGYTTDAFKVTHNSNDVLLSLYRRADQSTPQALIRTGGVSYFNGGNVGIGTTSPGAKLDVQGTILVNNEIQFVDSNMRIYRSSNDMRLRTGGSDKITIKAGGNVGIGTTSPAQKLHISGNLLLENNNEIRQKDSGGTQRTIIELDSSNDLNIGGSYSGALKFIGGGSYAEVMRIHDNGNVGIGTASPGRTLDVAGRGRFIDSTSTVDILSNTYIPLLITNTAGYAHARINGFEVGGNTTATNEGYIKTSDNSRRLNLDANGWRFVSANTELMRINPSGNVGIGTTSPDEKLHIGGNAKASNIYIADSIIHTGDVDTKIDFSTNSIGFDTAGSERMNISSTRKVSINGTEDELLALNVTDNGPVYMSFERSNYRKAYVGFGSPGENFSIANEVGTGGITISTGGGEKMRIKSDGNVGIGTTSPAEKLHVAADVRVDGSGGVAVKKIRSSYFSSSQNLDLEAGSSADIILTSNKVGIGTTSPLSKLQVVGTSTSGLIRLTDTSGVAIIASSNEAGSAWEDLELKADNILLTPQGGNVGIGTASPLAKTHIKGSNSGATAVANGTLIIEQGSAPSIQILSANSQTQSIKFGDPQDGDAGRITYAHPTDDMKFFTGGGERMVIDSSGNLGIGTTSPGAKLDIVGNGASSATTALLVENSATTELFRVRDDGSVYGTGGSGVDTNAAYGKDALISNAAGTFNTAVGTNSLQNNTASYNTALGAYALNTNTTGANNVAVGINSLRLNTIGGSNTAVGREASYDNTTGGSNTSIGYQASMNNATGSNNTAVGRDSLRSNTASSNTAVGYSAAKNNTSGVNLTALGSNALKDNTTGNSNIAIGYFSLEKNTTGADNVSVGTRALLNSLTGSKNTAIGHDTLRNTTASENTAVGYQALYNNTTAGGNTAVGNKSLINNTTGFANVSIGSLSSTSLVSGNYNTVLGQSAYRYGTGSNNTAIGQSSLQNTTSSLSTAVGYEAGKDNTTGSSITALGSYALANNTTGNYSVGLGAAAMFENTTGAQNVAIGWQSSYANTTGSNNTGVGHGSLRFNTGSNHVALGYQASYNNTTASDNVSIGYRALFANSTGSYNVAVGREALNSNTASNNTAVGYNAAKNNTTASITAFGKESGLSNTTGTGNTFIGDRSGRSNTTGAFNVVVGALALYSNQTGSYNVAVGRDSLQNNTASNNTALGYLSLNANTTGTHNVAVGFSALDANTTASNNTAIGTYSLTTNTTGTNNTAVGEDSLFYNSTGSSNTAVGGGSLRNNTAANNTAVGHTAAYNNTTGTSNSAFGQSALYTNQTGTRNNAFGNGALRYLNGGLGNEGFGNETFRSTTTGGYNVGVGDYAGYYNTTGSGNIGIGYRATFANTAGDYNVAMGHQALYNNTASFNTAVGKQALYNNTSGIRNTAIGENAGLSNTTGGHNVFLGSDAGRGRTTGGVNVAIGPLSLYATGGTSSSNIAIGYYCGFRNTTGGQNVAIGVSTMQDNTTGQDNLVLGHAAGGTGVGSHGNSNVALGYAAKTGNFNSSVILGRAATATANNQFVVGSSSHNAGAVTTETITADKTWTVKINGVDYKIPIVAA